MSTVVIPRTFAYQSYFDSTLLSRALLPQTPGSIIVGSTFDRQTISGYAAGLHPASQTPVMVEFSSGRAGDKLGFFLRPGEIIRPLGDKAFTGFSWGLPFGWLGGGLAQLVIFQNLRSIADWGVRQEVVFHRQRIAVRNNGGGAVTLASNWPLRFPWPNAFRDAASIAQGGGPIVHVQPTRTVLRLRGQPTNSAAMRALIFRNADLDEASDGSYPAIPSQVAYEDIVWPSVTNSGVTVGGSATTEMPTIVLDATHPLTLLGGDQCAVIFVSVSGDTTLDGLFVDVERFGVV